MKQRRISLRTAILLSINLFFNGWWLFSKFVFNWPFLIVLPLWLLLLPILALRGFWLLIKGSPWSRAANHVLPLFIFAIITAIPRSYIAQIEYRMRAKEFAADVVSSIGTEGKYMRWETWGSWAESVDYFVYSMTPLTLGSETNIPDFTCSDETQQIDVNYYVFFSDCLDNY